MTPKIFLINSAKNSILITNTYSGIQDPGLLGTKIKELPLCPKEANPLLTGLNGGTSCNLHWPCELFHPLFWQKLWGIYREIGLTKIFGGTSIEG